MNFSFEGKRVLVTGGADGLGKVIVQKFYECGATVIVADINEQLLSLLKKELPNINTICVDLSKWDEAKKMIEKCGVLDHLVNNAGICPYEPIGSVSEKSVDKLIDVNFKAVFNLSQEFANNVIANSTKGATIVNISSVAGTVAFRGIGAYCCTKAAVSMLTKCFAVEFGEHDIRVNAVAPGPMQTALYNAFPDEVQKEAAIAMSRQPIPGHVDTSYVANLVLYLSSPLSKMMTGSISTVDGGYSVA